MVKPSGDLGAGVTAVVDSWPYSLSEIERAVYSVRNVADRVMVIVPDVVSSYTPEDFVNIGAEVVRLPFFGNFTTVRNWVMEQIQTPWVLLLFGNEVFAESDAGEFLDTVARVDRAGYHLTVVTSDHRDVLAHPVRLLPSSREVRFVGRIWPEVSGSLIEFGFRLELLDVHLIRDEDRRCTQPVTALLKASLSNLTEANPRHWRAQLAQAVLAWAEHRYGEAKRKINLLPKNLSGEPQLIARGLSALLLQDEGQHHRAWEMLGRLVEQYPFRADFWALAGESLLQLDRPEEASAALYRCLELGEVPVPHLPPGYASYSARLKVARAEIAARKTAQGLAHLLAIIEEYPGYRPAWQEVLSHLRTMLPDQVFAAMGTVIAPSKIRHFFTQITYPTEDEMRMVQWLSSGQFN